MKKKDIIYIVIGLVLGIGGGIYANSTSTNSSLIEVNTTLSWVFAIGMVIVMLGLVVCSYLLAKQIDKKVQL